MIITLLLYILYYSIVSAFFFLPPASWLPDALNTSFETAGEILGTLNFILPIDTFFDCLIFFLSFLLVYFFIKLIFIVLNFVRGSGEL